MKLTFVLLGLAVSGAGQAVNCAGIPGVVVLVLGLEACGGRPVIDLAKPPAPVATLAAEAHEGQAREDAEVARHRELELLEELAYQSYHIAKEANDANHTPGDEKAVRERYKAWQDARDKLLHVTHLECPYGEILVPSEQACYWIYEDAEFDWMKVWASGNWPCTKLVTQPGRTVCRWPARVVEGR